MIDPETVAADLLAVAQEELRAAGEEVREDVAGELRDVAADLATLVARRAQGEDVDAELRHVRARVANWSWVAADRVTQRWIDALVRIGHGVGVAARAVAVGALAP